MVVGGVSIVAAFTRSFASLVVIDGVYLFFPLLLLLLLLLLLVFFPFNRMFYIHIFGMKVKSGHNHGDDDDDDEDGDKADENHDTMMVIT